MRSLFSLALFVAATMPLAGCMTSGTNIHGDFTCRAPNGTCAPMSVIDDKAVAGIGSGTQPVGGIVDPAFPREGRAVIASADGSPPGRTSDRVLRVVFPAHIDPGGIYHDASTAHAVVERGEWTDGLTGAARRAATAGTAGNMKSGNPADLQTSKLATLDEVIAARAAMTARMPVPTAGPSVLPTSPAGLSPIALRAPFAFDLREAAAAASAQPIAGLDPNFDTPDVAAVTAAPDDRVTSCAVYRKIRWRGRTYRRPFQRPCAGPATVAEADPGAESSSAAVSTWSLNLAHLNQAAPDTVALSASLAPAKSFAPPPAIVGPPNPANAIAPAALGTAGVVTPAARFAPTEDRQLAAARIRAMAAPTIAETAARGRAEARAQDVNLGEMFARAGVPEATPGVSLEQAPR